MNIGWPEGIWLGLTLGGLLLVANLHGKPKTGKWDIFVTIINSVIMFGILYWGGFFK